jgi:2-polyprenyl-3-methyl-5-hydroxy-6-metoxy-1,4-benzoquinol methylase
MLAKIRKLLAQRRNRRDIYSTAAYWDSKAHSYEDAAVSMWPNESLNRLYDTEQKRMIALHIGDVAGLDFLDVGCGTGRLSRWFANSGARVAGIDFSDASLEIARRASDGDNPQYRHVSVFELSDENAYDIVLTWGVLTIACQDRDQLADALLRIQRAMRPSGKLFLMEPIHSGFLSRVLKLRLGDFVAVMKETGFEVHASAPLHFWPMRLALAYVPWPMWVTAPLYHIGQAAMRLPGLRRLGDYQMIVASVRARPGDAVGM